MSLKKIRFFGIMSSADRFFETVKEGEIFRFSDGYCLEEVRKMAERRGVKIEYCPPGSYEYKQYGSMTVRVIRNKILNPEVQMFHFDPVLIDN